ncbi:MAG: histidine--tRNA ligase [Bacteroidales bacterium]|jgi:histidyl-tRNA synthetase|nr:histidine--tRNA ligase [Bacteroidales bacterium]
MAEKPSVPKGTRDFTPEEMLRRNYIFNTIRTVFERYAYVPIETPAMEKLSTLLGKYGDEGDKLLFKVLNSGDYLKKVQDNELAERNPNALVSKISEKGLRYDLTVPFARFVVQHQNELTFPFKRYQIQPVWRADRPQKGRYREFYQCDVDVIGSDSLLNEFELVQIIDEVFTLLNVPVIIKINNRKILLGIAESMGLESQFMNITVAIDKLDKIGEEKVVEELCGFYIDESKAKALLEFFTANGDFISKLQLLKTRLSNSESGQKGIAEIERLWDYFSAANFNAEIELDLSLARGLNYYTGAIFEVKARDVQIGSICGGGRYDDLTGIFGLEDMSGVGVSFGADRIYDVLLQSDRFPEAEMKQSDVLFINFGEKEEAYCLPILADLRKLDLRAEIYPDAAKMKKQMKYADKKQIPWVIMVGEEEMNSGKLKLKNMQSGEEALLTRQEILEKFK